MSATPKTMTRAISVAMVEDAPTAREGLVLLVGGRAGFDVVARHASVEEALGKMCPPVVDGPAALA